MEKIRRVFKRDVHAIVHNPVAILIVLGVVVLPSLYAWVNLIASWDPYSNTSTLPVAVINEDVGTMLNDEEINIGDSVVEELKSNDQIEWHFVESSEEADKELQKGTYYASIIITETFSEDLLSILSKEPIKPVIVYKSDTKENPVIGKIMNAVQESLVNNIKLNFLMTVNETIFKKLNDINEKVSDKEKQILMLKTTLVVLDSNLDYIISSLTNATDTSANLSVYLSSLKSTLPTLQKSLTTMQEDNAQAREQARKNEKMMNETLDNIEDNIVLVQENNVKQNELINDTVKTANQATKTYQQQQAEAVKTTYEESINQVDYLIAYNEMLLEAATTEDKKAQIQAEIDSLNELNTQLEAQEENVNKLSEKVATSGDSAEENVQEMTEAQVQTADEIAESLVVYNNNLKENYKEVNQNYIEATYLNDQTLANTSAMITSFGRSLSVAIERSDLNTDISTKLLEDLIYFREGINTINGMLENIDNSQIKIGIAILSTPAEEMADYLSNPFEIVDEAIYPVENYGSAMAPMYSALAMWVGAVILTSVF